MSSSSFQSITTGAWALPTTSPFLSQQNANMCLLLPLKSHYIPFSFSLPQKNTDMFPLCFLFKGQEGLDGERGKPGQQGLPVRDAALFKVPMPQTWENQGVGRAAVGVCGELWNEGIPISQAMEWAFWATFETNKWVTKQGALPVPALKPSFLNEGLEIVGNGWWEMTMALEGSAWKWSIWCAAGPVWGENILFCLQVVSSQTSEKLCERLN